MRKITFKQSTLSRIPLLNWFFKFRFFVIILPYSYEQLISCKTISSPPTITKPARFRAGSSSHYVCRFLEIIFFSVIFSHSIPHTLPFSSRFSIWLYIHALFSFNNSLRFLPRSILWNSYYNP